MPLVDYPDSDGSDQPPPNSSNHTQGTKRKHLTPLTSPTTSPTASHPPKSTLPPLPSIFHDLYATSTRLSNRDDPSLHGGRQRQTPHIEGNWPTHVYIEFFPPSETFTRLQSLIADINNKNGNHHHYHNGPNSHPNNYDDTTSVDKQPADRTIHTLLLSPLSAPLPLHISLSHPLTLRPEQRDPFLQNLAERIEQADIAPFTLHFSPQAAWHPNADRTRHFLVLRLLQSQPSSPSSSSSPPSSTPSSTLSSRNHSILTLLTAANATATSIGHPPIYTSPPPLPHQPILPPSAKRPKHPSSHASLPPGQSRTSQLDEKTILESLHVSIGWALTPPSSSLPRAVDSDADLRAGEAGVAGVENVTVAVPVANVKVKMGNAVHAIPLQRPRDRGGNGILGDG